MIRYICIFFYNFFRFGYFRLLFQNYDSFWKKSHQPRSRSISHENIRRAENQIFIICVNSVEVATVLFIAIVAMISFTPEKWQRLIKIAII